MIESMIENMVGLLVDLDSGPYSDYETWRTEQKAAGVAFNALCDLRTAMYHNQVGEGRYAICGDGTFHSLTDMDADEVESYCDGDWLILQQGMTVGQIARTAIEHGCDEQEVWSLICEYGRDLRAMMDQEDQLKRDRAHYDEMVLVMDPWDGAYPTGPRP